MSMDAAQSVGSELHESQLPDNRGPLATLEREARYCLLQCFFLSMTVSASYSKSPWTSLYLSA